jgi:nitrogen regulatory protein P-II 1
MKEIKAIIQPHMLNKVMEALHALPHFPGVTVSDCQGHGRGRGTGGAHAPTEESFFPARMIKLEMFCADDWCAGLVDVIQKASRTGHAGDGVIIVSDLLRIVRIGTGEQQEKAV